MTLSLRSTSSAKKLNRANLGIEVMHERNAHQFPLDLASSADFQPVAALQSDFQADFQPASLTAPAIAG